MPSMPFSKQYSYEFGTYTDGVYDVGSGWDGLNGDAMTDCVVTAVYTRSVKTYRVTWYSKPGLSLGSTVVEYGSDVVYSGATPTNDSENDTYIYNVFAGWNKSTGYITDDIDVYAIWDRAELPAVGRDLCDMSPGEVHAVIASKRTSSYFVLKDYIDINLGHDFDFENVESKVIAQDLYLDGSTAIDTSISLFGEDDCSFTIAIDYRFVDTTVNNTLVSCYESNGQEGFRLRYNSYPNVQWGDVSHSFGNGKYRDIVVLRHRKGDNTIYVYASNSTGSSTQFSGEISIAELTRTRSTRTNAVLTFGATKNIEDGSYDDYGMGHIYWCKVWYEDLGDSNARQLATWSHEPLRMEYYGTEQYRLSSGANQKTNASFICNHCLDDRKKAIGNAGQGWHTSSMRTFMNSRIKPAMPTVWQSMIKQSRIPASAGNKSIEIIVSDDYVFLPSLVEIANNTSSPYASEGSYIPWFTSDKYRIKFLGLVVPDDATYFANGANDDPSAYESNNIKQGDVWNQGYIYVTKEYLDTRGRTPSKTAAGGGGWIGSTTWWLRSANASNANCFTGINATGGTYNYSYDYEARDALGVCPCFNI